MVLDSLQACDTFAGFARRASGPLWAGLAAPLDPCSPRRYTVLLADRSTGVVRRVTISLRAMLAVGAGLLAVPVVLGVGARASVDADVRRLQAANAALELENESFRAATGELTGQIASLQGVLSDLGEKTKLDPAAIAAINKLPAMVRNRAMGGSPVGPGDGQDPARDGELAREHVRRAPHGARQPRTAPARRSAPTSRGSRRWPTRPPPSGPRWAGSPTASAAGRTRSPGNSGSHEGLDISGDRGDPVFAAAQGTVQSAGWSGDFGNLIVVTHEFGLVTRYAHLSKILVKPGDFVSRGQAIGHVGSTGRSTGPHLHYEVWANGRPINPLSLLTSQQRR